jgi:hypothetical protein
VRLLVRLDPEFDVFVVVELSLVVQSFVLQTLEEHGQSVVEHGPAFFRANTYDLLGDVAVAEFDYRQAYNTEYPYDG